MKKGRQDRIAETLTISVSLSQTPPALSLIHIYIVEMEGHRWEVVLPDGSKTPIDRNDFSFMENGEKKQFEMCIRDR